MKMLRLILPKIVQVVETRIDRAGKLFPDEDEAVVNAVVKRRREFTTVRVCAREALLGLGFDPAPLVPGQGGAPVWPQGIVGSMTHCQGFRAAAVANSDEVEAIGIDAEPNAPLLPEVLAAIASPDEIRMLRDMGSRYCGVALDRLLFCTKEAVYKAWFPAHGYYIPPSQIRVDLWDKEFRATLTDATANHVLWGAWAEAQGIVSAATVTVSPGGDQSLQKT